MFGFNAQPVMKQAQKPVFAIDAEGNLKLTNVPVPYPLRRVRDRFKVYDLLRMARKKQPFAIFTGYQKRRGTWSRARWGHVFAG